MFSTEQKDERLGTAEALHGLNTLRRNFRVGRVAVIREALPAWQGANSACVFSQEKSELIDQKIQLPGG